LYYKVLDYPLPSRYLYLKTEIYEDIRGGLYRDTLIEVKYKNTKAIYDVNGKEVKSSTYGKAWLNAGNFFKETDKLDVENYSRFILWFISGGITFWLTLSLMT
jgi:hypothetical protein